MAFKKLPFVVIFLSKSLLCSLKKWYICKQITHKDTKKRKI